MFLVHAPELMACLAQLPVSISVMFEEAGEGGSLLGPHVDILGGNLGLLEFEAREAHVGETGCHGDGLCGVLAGCACAAWVIMGLHRTHGCW